MRTRRPGTCHGFTLMELLVVISIITISAGLSCGALMDWLPNYRLRRAAWDLFSTLQRAKAASIHQGAETAVYFSIEDNAYHLIGSGPDQKYDGLNEGNDDLLIKTVFLSDYGSGVRYGHGSAERNATTKPGNGFPGDGVSFVGNTSIFDSSGMTRRLGYVYLENDDEAVFAVAAPTMAGLVRLVRWDGRNWR